jgi:hypothetical protein
MLLQRVLAQMGIEPERVKLVWASAAEGAKFAEETTRFVEQIRALGPLNWKDEGGRMKAENDSSFIPHPSAFAPEVPA